LASWCPEYLMGRPTKGFNRRASPFGKTWGAIGGERKKKTKKTCRLNNNKKIDMGKKEKTLTERGKGGGIEYLWGLEEG